MNIEYLPLRQLNARFRDTINHATQQLLKVMPLRNSKKPMPATSARNIA